MGIEIKNTIISYIMNAKVNIESNDPHRALSFLYAARAEIDTVLCNNPKRIQLKRTRGWRKPENAVVVSRPTRWGNPFNWQDIIMRLDSSDPKKAATIEYEYWLTGMGPYGEKFPERRQWILDHIHELRGKDLACWCKPSDACHADVLLQLANEAETPGV